MENKVVNSEKIVIGRFDAGEDLLSALRYCAEQNNIKCGWFNVIGGLKKLTYGLFEDNGRYRTLMKEAKCCFELLPTFGNITTKEGAIFIHAHVNAADEEEGISFGGHLLEGSVIYPFVEVVMQGCDVQIERFFDTRTGLWPLKF